MTTENPTTAPSATPTPWRSRILRHAEVAPEELIPNAGNARRHPKTQQKALNGLLSTVGWVQSVVVSERSGMIVDGHLRHDLALRNGAATVPCVYVDLTEDEERMMLAAFDAVGGLADVDTRQLSLLLEGLQVPDGANLDFLEFLAAQTEESTPVPVNGASSPEEEMVRFAGSGVKQLVFYVEHAAYAVVVDKLEAVRMARKLPDHSAVLLTLLNEAYHALPHD